MKDINSKFIISRTAKGTITLCRMCHNVVEDIVNKGRTRKLWYDKGYLQGIEDYKAQLSWQEGKTDGEAGVEE